MKMPTTHSGFFSAVTTLLILITNAGAYAQCMPLGHALRVRGNGRDACAAPPGQ